MKIVKQDNEIRIYGDSADCKWFIFFSRYNRDSQYMGSLALPKNITVKSKKIKKGRINIGIRQESSEIKVIFTTEGDK